MQRALRRSLLTALVGAAGAMACRTPAQPTVCESKPSIARLNVEDLEQVCSGPARWYFVDADSNGPAFPASFAQCVREGLDEWLLGDVCRSARLEQIFRCAEGDPNCGLTAHGVVSSVVPVLPERSSAGFGRSDGHRRFFRLAFQSQAEGRHALDVLPQGHCELMTTLREVAAQCKGEASVKAGREWCAVQAAEVDVGLGHRTVDGVFNPRATWHLHQIGLEDAAGSMKWPLDPSAGAEAAARMVLLDTRIQDVPPGPYVPLFEPSSPRYIAPGARAAAHQHGAVMAVLARTIAGPIRIYNSAVLDNDGFGSVSALVRGIDGALFDLRDPTGPYQPLVLNMSLGFPPELEDPVSLQCRVGTATQDGIAEPIRYILRVARAMDSPDRPTAIFAAAGNRLERSSAPSIVGEAVGLETRGGPTSTELYYPAQLAEVDPECISRSSTCGPLVMPVDAVDARGEPSALSTNGSRPGLVAPGVGIVPFPVLDPPQPNLDPYPWSATPTNPTCTPFRRRVPLGYNQPSAHTGSSLAAIMASATAMYTFYALEDVPAHRLSGAGVARLLFLLGVDPKTGRPAGERRRLCVSRVREAVGALSKELVSCLNTSHRSWTSRECARFLPELTATCPLASTPAFPRNPEDIRTRLCGFERPAETRTTGWVKGSGVYLSGELLSTHEAGVLGPQPGDPVCIPPCGLTSFYDLVTRTTKLTLVIQLSEELDPGTKILAPGLVLRRPGAEASIDLLGGWTHPEWWFPGSSFVVEGIDGPPGWDLANPEVTAILALTIEQDGKQTSSFSAMEIDLR